jgi:hypothetical protein
VATEPGRADYDQALKALLTRAHDGVLALAAPDLAFVAERPTELPAERRQADLVWEVSGPDGQRGILHLELQTRVEADLGERLLEYFVRLRRHYRLPVRSVVFLLRESRQPLPLPVRLAWGGNTALSFDCDVVRLWELPQTLVLARPEPALWPLAALMAGATLATVEEVAGRLARAPELAVAERRELLGLAGLRLPREAVLHVLRREPMIRDILRDSSVGQGWFDEGRQEGRQEGRRELVRQALEDRFGTVDADVQAALVTADAGTLRAVVANLAVDSPAQVRRRLGL